MTMNVKVIKQIYIYDGIELPVPARLQGNDTALRAFHATLYPPIATADAIQSKDADGNIVTEYRRTIGTKG